jgi:hypothetical protein
MDMASFIAAAFLGVESDEISALHFLKYCNAGTGLDNMLSDKKDGGQYLRNHSGKYSARDIAPARLTLESRYASLLETLGRGAQAKLDLPEFASNID